MKIFSHEIALCVFENFTEKEFKGYVKATKKMLICRAYEEMQEENQIYIVEFKKRYWSDSEIEAAIATRTVSSGEFIWEHEFIHYDEFKQVLKEIKPFDLVLELIFTKEE